MSRRGSWLAILAVLMLLLAACGPETETSTPPGEAGQASATEVEEVAPADEPADEPVDKPADEPVDEPAKEPADGPAKEPADEGAATGEVDSPPEPEAEGAAWNAVGSPDAPVTIVEYSDFQ